MIPFNGIKVVVDNKIEEDYMEWDKKLKAYKCTQKVMDKIKKMIPNSASTNK